MIDDGLSLMRGGPVYRLLRALGLIGPHRRTSRLVAVLLTTIAVGPLLALTARDGNCSRDSAG
ncbi:hypothetical protein [Pseudoxanthomonas sp. Soil82]|uniref:hypothetical protein n=1 Tax=Pseudoxanthomonas sp. Soil82 TaxID=3157341 RepID=UPI00339027E3